MTEEVGVTQRSEWMVSMMAFFGLSFALLACAPGPPGAGALQPMAAEPQIHPELLELAERVAEPRFIPVSPRVTVAYAFDFANITFIEGDDGIIVIDAGWSPDAAREAIVAYGAEVSSKPIVALIYSHGHADHVGGAAAFAEAGGEDLEVYAEHRWKEYQLERVGPSAPHFGIRAAAQMGLLLKPGLDGRVPSGGGRIRSDALTFRYVPPTREIKGETTLRISGVSIVAKPMPSETSDQLLFWLPEEKVAFAGDIAAGALPILSTPRNERGRVPTGFIDGIAWLLELPLETLIAGHNPPMKGRREATEALLKYRDASQSIFDQTMQALNANLSLEEAAVAVRLPPHLAEDPLLRDHYHRLPWVVKGVYTRYGGWFQGDAATLDPLAPSEEATRIVELGGGADRILASAVRASSAGEYRWAAQLAGYLMRSGQHVQQAGRIKVNALRAMAYASDSGNQRNYMLTQANVMSGEIDVGLIQRVRMPLELLGLLETRELFRLMGPALDSKRCGDENVSVAFSLSDLGETHRYSLRRGIGYYQAGAGEGADARVRLTRNLLEQIIGNHLRWSDAIESGQAEVSGQPERFEQFKVCFGPGVARDRSDP